MLTQTTTEPDRHPRGYMLQQFSTPARTLVAATALGMLTLAGPLLAQTLGLADRAPSSHTVQKGDTLWGIAGKFLKEPWRWPEIWRMNRDQIRNPHLIYPGDVIRLDIVDGQPQLSIEQRPTVRISPSTRITALESDAIPSIPPGDIEPYLTKPLITGPDGFADAAEILSARNSERVVRGAGDIVYVLGMNPKAGDLWHVYRPVGPVTTLDRREVLGYEAKFLGTARVEKFGDLSTVRIETSVEEMQIGDRMIPAPREVIANYAPRAPNRSIDARIVRVPYENIETGRGYIVTLDKGKQDGVEPGHVLAVYRVVDRIVDPRPSKQQTILLRYLEPTTFFTPREYMQPADERTGLVFVFRTFDRLSYAIVLNTTDPVRVGDYARKP